MMFIKLSTSDATYYVNQDDVNYVIVPDNAEQDIVINCNRGHDIKIPMPTDHKDQNKRIIDNLIMFWITITNPNNMIYINPSNVSVITKTDNYTIRFKNTAGLVCENLNCKGNFAV